MASSRKRPLPAWTLPRPPKRKLPRRARALRLAWGLFIVVGLPLGFMAALGPLAYAGIYIEPLRQFWQPWPPDIMKGIGSAAGFAATLGYLAYRKGRSAGYANGAIAERASARNRAEHERAEAKRMGPQATASAAAPPPPADLTPPAPVEIPEIPAE